MGLEVELCLLTTPKRGMGSGVESIKESVRRKQHTVKLLVISESFLNEPYKVLSCDG